MIRLRSSVPTLMPLAVVAVASALLVSGCGNDDNAGASASPPAADGQTVFRHDTFGNETQWTDTLQLHTVIQSAVDPKTAASVGLKIDADALPAPVVQGIQSGAIPLNDPQTTLALLQLDAVVGVKGQVSKTGDGR